VQFACRIRDALDEIAVGCALAMAIGTYATNPGDHAIAGRLTTTVANGVLGYAVACMIGR